MMDFTYCCKMPIERVSHQTWTFRRLAQLSGHHQSALTPWIDQRVRGTFPTPPNCLMWSANMNQIATLPLVSCQRISVMPSPSKSPVSTIDQAVGTFPIPAYVNCGLPSIANQIATLPLLSRQRMSL